MKYKLVRDVTVTECHWLERDMKSGEIVHLYTGNVYGCIDTGIAVSMKPNETPFFELPLNALVVVP